MKKFILLFVITFIAGHLLAQSPQLPDLKQKSNPAKIAEKIDLKCPLVLSSHPKSILSEGFEGANFPPTGWTQLITIPAFTWHLDTSHSTPHSGNNKAGVLYDDQLRTQNEWLYSPVVNLTSYAHPMIEFWWNMSYYWGVTPYNNYNLNLKISTDGGTTWTQLWSEDSVGVFTSFEWYRKTFDLTAYNTFSNVKFGFQYYGRDGAACALDDIIIDEYRNNDLAIGSFLFSTSYTQIPLSQTDTIQFATDLTNIGYMAQPNCKLNVHVNGSVFSSQSSPMNFPRGYYDTLVANDIFVPSATGNYTVSYAISSDSVDQSPFDNFDTTYFKVTNTMYAADNNNYINGYYEWGYIDTNTLETQSFVIGNRFLIPASGTATSIYVGLAKGTTAGATIVANLYDDIANVPIANSELYIIKPEDIMTTTGEAPKLIRLPLTSQISMTGPAYYFAGIEYYGGHDTVKVAVSSKYGYKWNQISLIYYNDPQGLDWYNLGSATPMVRLGVNEPDFGITETGNKGITLQNMPNPASNYTLVNYSISVNSSVILSIFDITGKQLLSLDEGNKNAGVYSKQINLSNLSAGSYFLKLSAGEKSVVKKLIVVK